MDPDLKYFKENHDKVTCQITESEIKTALMSALFATYGDKIILIWL